MPTTLKAFARGTFATSNTTLYTTPSATTAVVTNISICNTTASSITFNLLIDGVEMFSSTPLKEYSTTVVDLKQVLSATKLIAGSASASGLTYHISGAEIV